MCIVWLKSKIYRWSAISSLMKLRISQAASLIPIAGYAILWSEKFDGLLQYQKAWESVSLFTISSRLHMVYFGSISLTFALIVFWIFCPRFIQRQSTIEEYIIEQEQTANNYIFNGIYMSNKELIQEKGQTVTYKEDAGYILRTQLQSEDPAGTKLNVGDRKTAFRIHYLQHEDKNFPAIIITCILLMLGVFLFLMPSLEVFYLVMRSLI